MFDPERAIATFTIFPIGSEAEPSFPGHLPETTPDGPMTLFVRRSDLLALLPSYWKDTLQHNGGPASSFSSLNGGGLQQLWYDRDINMDEDTACTTRPLFGTVSWEIWGPSNTRLLSLYPSSSSSPSGFVTATSGERFVFNRQVDGSILDDEDRKQGLLTVIDMNRYRVQRSIMGFSPPSRVSVYYEPPKGLGGDTRMPIMTLQATKKNEYAEIIVDEERIIGLQGWDYDDDPMRIDHLVVSHFG